MLETTKGALKTAVANLTTDKRVLERDVKTLLGRAHDAEHDRDVWRGATQMISEDRDRLAAAVRCCLRDRHDPDRVYAACVDALGPNEASTVLRGAA